MLSLTSCNLRSYVCTWSSHSSLFYLFISNYLSSFCPCSQTVDYMRVEKRILQIQIINTKHSSVSLLTGEDEMSYWHYLWILNLLSLNAKGYIFRISTCFWQIAWQRGSHHLNTRTRVSEKQEPWSVRCRGEIQNSPSTINSRQLMAVLLHPNLERTPHSIKMCLTGGNIAVRCSPKPHSF